MSVIAPELILSIAAAARLLGLTRGFIREQIRKGTMRPTSSRRQLVLFQISTIEALKTHAN